jgi:hypothetical protein
MNACLLCDIRVSDCVLHGQVPTEVHNKPKNNKQKQKYGGIIDCDSLGSLERLGKH